MNRTLVRNLPFLLLLATLAPACGESASSESTSSVRSDEPSQRPSQSSCETRKLQCDVAVSSLQARLNQMDPTSARFELVLGQMIDKQVECGQIAASCEL